LKNTKGYKNEPGAVHAPGLVFSGILEGNQHGSKSEKLKKVFPFSCQIYKN